MPVYEASVTTPWSADRAFRYMADLSNYDEWDPGTKSATLVSGQPGEPGSTYDLKVGGKTLRYTIVDVEDERRIVAQAQADSIASTDTVTITETTVGAVVTYNAELQLKGLARLAAPLIGWRFKKMGDEAAGGLAAQLQGQLVRTAA